MNISALNSVGISGSTVKQALNNEQIVSKDVFSYVTSVSQEIKDYVTKHPASGVLCPNGLSDINRNLRWNREITDFDKKLVNAIDSAFEKLPPLQEDRTFYRGVAGRDLDKNILEAKAGDIISPDRGFPQVGLKQYYAEKYLPSEEFNPVLFEMRCPKGSTVSLSKRTGTGVEEGMLPRNAKFKILSKDTVNMPRLLYLDYNTGAPVCEDRNVTKYVLEMLN